MKNVNPIAAMKADPPPPVAESLQHIESELLLATKHSLISQKPPQIIAVSKTHGADVIRLALEAGHRHFGENQVQEAAAKWPELKRDYPDVTLHLIGALQSNKAADAVALFDVIHSIDRPKIAQAVRDACDKQGRQLACLIQVNSGEEPQKAGIIPAALGDFVMLCRGEIGLNVRGLMCIPPAQGNPAPHFALLGKLAREYGLRELSMGMSGDYALAASLGAYWVRIGSAIFGSR